MQTLKKMMFFFGMIYLTSCTVGSKKEVADNLDTPGCKEPLDQSRITDSLAQIKQKNKIPARLILCTGSRSALWNKTNSAEHF